MKFSTREDIEAPIDHVFKAISDFDRFERQALRRGVALVPSTALKRPDAQRGWMISFDYRSKRRNIEAELIKFSPPTMMEFNSETRGVSGLGIIELVPMSPSRTRLLLSLDLRPVSLVGRLWIQSLKLVKARINRQFKKRTEIFARHIENNYKR